MPESLLHYVQVADLDLSSSSKYSGDKRGDRKHFSSSGGRYVPPHMRQRGGSRDDDGYDDAPLPTRTSYGKPMGNRILTYRIA